MPTRSHRALALPDPLAALTAAAATRFHRHAAVLPDPGGSIAAAVAGALAIIAAGPPAPPGAATSASVIVPAGRGRLVSVTIHITISPEEPV